MVNAFYSFDGRNWFHYGLISRWRLYWFRLLLLFSLVDVVWFSGRVITEGCQFDPDELHLYMPTGSIGPRPTRIRSVKMIIKHHRGEL